ncbi:hypothetical protein CH63R_09594 [Colletotrichum higginsianum IMI 349063]|uniref:Ankyrin repeat protein n=1 Tax=Colletotrichum higginsianum (strain IMI 349063) TaxID=759273 RepID=A0A1B7Y7M8_COLHI|nr:hypothetical protein CH63R_09594 [Colletotrichum higginsianum IMI 349063]OBR08073.1 hypothetical protein CH63R_09594 [Colletotrichum higginsianum IMI 349063]
MSALFNTAMAVESSELRLDTLATKVVSDDMMALLFEKRPARKSLLAALHVALSLVEEHIRLRRTKVLMASGPSGEAVDRSLIHVIRSCLINRELVDTLLFGASVYYRQGEVFTHVISSLDMDVLLRLLQAKSPGQAAFTTAWQAIWVQAFLKVCQEDQLDLGLISTLLEAGAPVEHSAGTCFLHAASTFQLPLLKMLGSKVVDETLFSSAFSSAVDRSEEEGTEPHHIPTLQYLLRNGAKSRVVFETVHAAAAPCKLPALQMLAETTGVDETLFTFVFDQVIRREDVWHTTDHVRVVELLPEHGATGEPVAALLLMASTATLKDDAPSLPVDVLLGGKRERQLQGRRSRPDGGGV